MKDIYHKGTITLEEMEQLAKERYVQPLKGRHMTIVGGPCYFFPPHGGRPPSDEAVRLQTRRYIECSLKKRN